MDRNIWRRIVSISVRQISQDFGGNIALEQVDLDIHDGEFFSLLGPSGCGKTTLLNIIAGFLEPTTGSVFINGDDVTNLPPYKRKIGMVFQNYALFPHLTVFDNVAYGLKVKKLSKKEVRRKVEESLALVQLEAFQERMPKQLSGGQQQRVAIARALAIEPSVLLLDEPLSNLDANLRKDMQTELRLLQKRIGITTVLVTHDQEEALSLSDRIGVLGQGHIRQIGSPLDVYRKPENEFVAGFIGQVNLLSVKKVASETDDNKTVYQAENFTMSENEPLKLAMNKGSELEETTSLMMLRPERIRVVAESLNELYNSCKVTVVQVSYIGSSVRLTVKLQGKGEMLILVPDPVFHVPPEPEQVITIAWNKEDLILINQEETSS